MNPNPENNSDSEEEDELVKIFDKALTRKATKQTSVEMMENLDKKFEEEIKEEKKDEPDDRRLRLMKTKSFMIKSPESSLQLAKNESNKSKENWWKKDGVRKLNDLRKK